MNPWYLNPGWYAMIIAIISLATSSSLTIFTIKRSVKAQPEYKCDVQWFEILKLFISNPKLYEFYNIFPNLKKFWPDFSEDEKRLYLFAEINYFQLAFVYREYKAGRIEYGHWMTYKNWLDILLTHSEMFQKVCEVARGNYEEVFEQLVNDRIKYLKSKED